MLKRLFSLGHFNLQKKFFLYFAGLVLLVIAFVSVPVFYFQKQMLETQVREKAFSLTRSLAYISLNAILLDDYQALQLLVDSMKDSEDIISITILDSSGIVIAASDVQLRGQQYLDPLSQKTLRSDIFQIEQVSSEKDEHIWDTAVPIFELNKSIAIARIKYSVEDASKGLFEYILAIVGVALIISLILSYIYSRSVTKPIKDAVLLAREYGRGNFEVSIPEYPQDEIGELVISLNKLSQELNTLISEKISNEGLIMIGEFAAYIIHDLKNPLNGIHLLADGLHRKMPEDSPYKKYTAEILLASQRVEDFIKRTLNISKSTNLKIQQISINELVEETVQEVHLIPTRIMRQYARDIPLIPGDYAMLMMALKNLLINASQAITDNGIIKIETRWEDAAIISISDSGMGIEKERLSTIFRPFFSMKEKGDGLGLAMVKRAVNLHHGHIDVESEIGVGSTFTISLPAEQMQIDHD